MGGEGVIYVGDAPLKMGNPHLWSRMLGNLTLGIPHEVDPLTGTHASHP